MGIHKSGPDTRSSQLGIMSLGLKVLRADWPSRSCIVVCCVFCA